MKIVYELDDVFRTVKYSTAIHTAISDGEEKFKLRFPNIQTLKLILRKKPVEAIFPDGSNPRLSIKDEVVTVWIDFYYMPADSSLYEELMRIFNQEINEL